MAGVVAAGRRARPGGSSSGSGSGGGVVAGSEGRGDSVGGVVAQRLWEDLAGRVVWVG